MPDPAVGTLILLKRPPAGDRLVLDARAAGCIDRAGAAAFDLGQIRPRCVGLQQSSHSQGGTGDTRPDDCIGAFDASHCPSSWHDRL